MLEVIEGVHLIFIITIDAELLGGALGLADVEIRDAVECETHGTSPNITRMLLWNAARRRANSRRAAFSCHVSRRRVRRFSFPTALTVPRFPQRGRAFLQVALSSASANSINSAISGRNFRKRRQSRHSARMRQ
jgi:hypothetical protein